MPSGMTASTSIPQYDELAGQDSPVLVNLASNEYFKSVQSRKIWTARIITPVFKEERNGDYKFISFTAKKARGLMSRYIIRNRRGGTGRTEGLRPGRLPL